MCKYKFAYIYNYVCMCKYIYIPVCMFTYYIYMNV